MPKKWCATYIVEKGKLYRPGTHEYHKKVVEFIVNHTEEFSVVALDRFWKMMDDPEYKIQPIVHQGLKEGFHYADCAKAWMIELGIY